jgi:hypothetical protein
MSRSTIECEFSQSPTVEGLRAGYGNVHNDPDLISDKLPALHFYQLSIPAPSPPEAGERRFG